MEIEEIRGLNDKKGLWGSIHNFLSIHFWSSLYSLSLSHTLINLEHFLNTLAMERGRQRKFKKENGTKDQARKSWIKRLQQYYLQVLSCMYGFLASFDMHGICMCLFGSLDVTGIAFAKCDSGFKPCVAISR